MVEENHIKTLESVLTKEEAAFVREVFNRPGCRINGASQWEDDGTEYGKNVTHWENPERLGLIECVGSYKWIPTDKLDVGIKGEL